MLRKIKLFWIGLINKRNCCNCGATMKVIDFLEDFDTVYYECPKCNCILHAKNIKK